MNKKQILVALHQIKDSLREVRNELVDVRPENPIERVSFTAARQGVEAAEAELNSAIIAFEMIDLTK